MRSLLLALLILSSCIAKTSTSRWWIFSFHTYQCEVAEIKGQSAGPYELIANVRGCYVASFDSDNGLVKVDCTYNPGLGGYLYFSTTERACVKHYKHIFDVI